MAVYADVFATSHTFPRKLKNLHCCSAREIVSSWITATFEIFVVFQPYLSSAQCVAKVNSILRWIKKEESTLFIDSTTTYNKGGK